MSVLFLDEMIKSIRTNEEPTSEPEPIIPREQIRNIKNAPYCFPSWMLRQDGLNVQNSRDKLLQGLEIFIVACMFFQEGNHTWIGR